MTEYFEDKELPLFDSQEQRGYVFVDDETKTRGTTKQVLGLLKDGCWHTTNEMLQASTHRFACGIHALRQRGYVIETRVDTKKSCEYRLTGKREMIKVTPDLQSQYYATRHWRDTRKRRLEHDSWRCCNCKKSSDLHVHHWRYDLFAERLGDLMTLCGDCHARIHDNEAIMIAFPKSLSLEIANKIAGE